MLQSERNWVAIVDDEADIAQLFADALNANGINAKAFDDPSAAVNYLYKHQDKFSLVISDWRMSPIGGPELVKLVQQMDKQIKIIIMSAFEIEKDQLKEIEKEEYLRKPMHIVQLMEAVKKELIEPTIVIS